MKNYLIYAIFIGLEGVLGFDFNFAGNTFNTGNAGDGDTGDEDTSELSFRTTTTTQPPVATSCRVNPCRNGCSCEQSCRDENDYVCVPPAGRPFVGKNCEWEAIVQCTGDRMIRVSIPKDAIAQYAMGVDTVVLQGCNNAPSYTCNAALGLPSPSCGPISSPTGNYYVLECSANSLVRSSNGDFTFGQTIVFDRSSALVAMPHPIVNVQCMMATRPAISVIAPQLRGPGSITQTIFWQPLFGFYKTAWGQQPAILAGNSLVGSGEVAYITGERIHVRITASLNGIPATTLPEKHGMAITSCTITPVGGSGQAIPIIMSGVAVPGTPFPVSVQQPHGLMGGNVPSSAEGCAFSFQVFTYGPGTKLQLTCMVSINAAARRRRSDSEDDADAPKTEQVMANLLIFEEASEEKDDIPVISVLQDPGVEVIYVERPQSEQDQLEEIVQVLPTWSIVLFSLLALVATSMLVLIFKWNYFANYARSRLIG